MVVALARIACTPVWSWYFQFLRSVFGATSTQLRCVLEDEQAQRDQRAEPAAVALQQKREKEAAQRVANASRRKSNTDRRLSNEQRNMRTVQQEDRVAALTQAQEEMQRLQQHISSLQADVATSRVAGTTSEIAVSTGTVSRETTKQVPALIQQGGAIRVLAMPVMAQQVSVAGAPAIAGAKV